MLPGLFSQHVGKQERFPGDPWPHMPVLPSFYTMHTNGCTAGLYRAFTVPAGYLTDPRAPTLREPRQAEPPPAPKPTKRLELFTRQKRVRPDAAVQCELFAGVRA